MLPQTRAAGLVASSALLRVCLLCSSRESYWPSFCIGCGGGDDGIGTIAVDGKQQYAGDIAPVAYQVILEPGRGQFRVVFESPRLHPPRMNSLSFSCAQID